MVVTPGVARARSSPFSFTTMPMISGAAASVGREALNLRMTSSLSAICLTCLGETKLTASMCLKPAASECFQIFSFVFGGDEIGQSLPGIARAFDQFHGFHLSLQNSGFEFANVGIKGGGFERADQRVAGVRRIDDGVDPEAGGGVARVGLIFVGGADGFVEFFLLLSRRLFCLRARVA